MASLLTSESEKNVNISNMSSVDQIFKLKNIENSRLSTDSDEVSFDDESTILCTPKSFGSDLQEDINKFLSLSNDSDDDDDFEKIKSSYKNNSSTVSQRKLYKDPEISVSATVNVGANVVVSDVNHVLIRQPSKSSVNNKIPAPAWGDFSSLGKVPEFQCSKFVPKPDAKPSCNSGIKKTSVPGFTPK